MKTIAIFQGYFFPHVGGIERYTYNLAKEFKKKGYHTILITTKYKPDLLEHETLDYIEIFRLPIYAIFSSRYPIIKKNKEYREILCKLEKKNINSIMLNTRFQLTSLVGAKFAKKHNIPCCILEHGTSHFTVYNPILDFFGHIYEHLLTNKMKTLVSDFYGVSKACCEWLTHYHIQAKGVFYNAIDIKEEEFYETNFKEDIDNGILDKKEYNSKITILFAGRLLQDKGILLLLEAYAILKKKYANIELKIAGEGPLEEEIRKQKEVILLGKLEHEDMMKCYKKADIFINPSYSEGMPTAILEAGLMKCAVVATPVGGTKEIISDNKNGLFCDTNVKSIVETLEKVIINKELREKLANNLNKRVKETFSWKKTANEVLETIQYKT